MPVTIVDSVLASSSMLYSVYETCLYSGFTNIIRQLDQESTAVHPTTSSPVREVVTELPPSGREFDDPPPPPPPSPIPVQVQPAVVGPSNPPHEQAVIPWIWPFYPLSKRAPVATFYSVWLCTSRTASPELHEFLNKEVMNGAKRAFRPYLHFPPHITLAAYLPVRHPREQSKRVRQEQFRWFVQTVKVLPFERDSTLRNFRTCTYIPRHFGLFQRRISVRYCALCHICSPSAIASMISCL